MHRSSLRLIWLICWAVVPPALVQAQSPAGTWVAHTSARAITDVSTSGSVIWAASRGGIFSYDTDTGEINRYTAAEGLYTVEAQAIAYDAQQGTVWVGYNDGVLDRLDLGTGAVRTFFDIQRSERFPDKGINRLRLQATAFW